MGYVAAHFAEDEKLNYHNSNFNKTTNTGLKVSSFLMLSLIVSIFQLFIFQINGIYVSMAMAAIYVFVVMVLVSTKWKFDAVAKTVFLLLLFQLFSLLWSPDKALAARDFVYSIPFVFIYIFSENQSRRDEHVVVRCLKVFCLVSVIQSLLVVFFLVSPSMEGTFLGGPLAKFFINPNGLSTFQLFSDNNVSDPDKSGGFFLNANVAAVYAELCVCASIIVSQYSQRKWFWRTIITLHIAAVVCTGSKSALIVLVTAPAVAWFILNVTNRMTGLRISKIAVFLVVAFLGAYTAYWLLSDTALLDAASLAAYQREVIWQYAKGAFLEAPIFGQGYGGWTLGFGAYGYAWRDVGINENMPAHNIFIIWWSQSGIIAVIMGGMFIFFALKGVAKAKYKPGGAVISGAAIAAIYAFFFHAMGDNVSPFTELHIQALFASLLGLVIGRGAMPWRNLNVAFRKAP